MAHGELGRGEEVTPGVQRTLVTTRSLSSCPDHHRHPEHAGGPV